jgi:hypothetical protein
MTRTRHFNKHIEGGPYPEPMLQQLHLFACGIEKAVAGGWNMNLLEDDWHVHASIFGKAEFCFPKPSEERVVHIALFEILYDHQFARAVWGDEFKRHLQEMVVSADPLQYLGENT